MNGIEWWECDGSVRPGIVVEVDAMHTEAGLLDHAPSQLMFHGLTPSAVACP